MSELDFSDLIPSSKPPASAGLSFDDLVPQEASSVPAAFADVPKEIANSAAENVAAIKRGLTPSGQGERGFLERSGDLAKGLAGIPGLVLSPVTGAARSLIGHPLADAEHQVGKLIAPEIAAKDDPAAMYERAKGDVDLAMSGTRAATPKPPAVATPTIAELKAASNAAYNSPEVLGLELKPGSVKGYSDKTKLSLNNEGFDDIVSPKTFAILDRVQAFPPDAIVTGQNLNSLRKTLGKIAGSPDKTEAAAASKAIEHLDDFVPNIGRQDVLNGDAAAAAAKFEEARGNWAAASQSEKIDKKIVRAQIRADASNSGMNVENQIRQRMADVVINPKEARGLTPSEIEQAKKISEGTKTQNAMRFVGNGLAGGGGIGMAITGIPTAGIAPAAGVALKLLSNRMTLKQAERLSEAIRMRAPLASSAEKFGEAFSKYQAEKSAGNYAGAVIAARNLSSNLQGAGFDGAIGGFLRSLAIPGQGSAEDGKDVPRRE